MKYQLITGTYKGDNSISLFARDENLEFKEIKVIGFEPYFFVPNELVHSHNRVANIEKKVAKSIYGEELAKLITFTPGDVPSVRDTFETHFEADIPFVRRFMIDTGIFGGFEIEGHRTTISFRRVKPVDFSLNPRICFCDIETFTKEGVDASNVNEDPVIINCVYDSNTKKYLSMVLHPNGKEGTKDYAEDHKAVFFANERNLLKASSKFLEFVKFDVYTAWYVNFDKRYQEDRGDMENIHFPWYKTNIFDIMEGNRTINPKASDKLADVIVDEGLDIPNYEPFRTEFWKNDLDRAILCNKSHVEAIVEINKLHNIIDFFWEGKNLAGFEDMSAGFHHSSIIENLYLRKAHSRGLIVPSRPRKAEVERRKVKYENLKTGGLVTAPPVGLFENQAVFDMSRYYIELLIQQNISPENHEGVLGIMPEIGQDLVDRRLVYDKLLRETEPGSPDYKIVELRRKNVKFATESVIGFLGHEPSRIFDPDGYNKVTTKGQKGLLFLDEVCKKDGYLMQYADTDGINVKMPLEKAIPYVDYLNEQLKVFSKNEGLSRTLRLKLDRYFKRIIFKRKKGEDEGVGAKKRFAGWVVWEDGKPCDYLLIKGFEYVRRDASNATKNIQHEIFEHILRGNPDETKKYLTGEIRKIERGIYPLKDIAIPKTLHQRPESYPKPQDYVRGAVYANKWLDTKIRAEDRIRMLYITSTGKYPPTDVISVLDTNIIPECFKINIDKLVEKTVKDKIEDIIELIGLSWKDVYHPSNALF